MNPTSYFVGFDSDSCAACPRPLRHQLGGVQRLGDGVGPQGRAQGLVARPHRGAADGRRDHAQADRREEESRRRGAAGTRGERKRRRRVQRWVVVHRWPLKGVCAQWTQVSSTLVFRRRHAVERPAASPRPRPQDESAGRQSAGATSEPSLSVRETLLTREDDAKTPAGPRRRENRTNIGFYFENHTFILYYLNPEQFSGFTFFFIIHVSLSEVVTFNVNILREAERTPTCL